MNSIHYFASMIGTIDYVYFCQSIHIENVMAGKSEY